MSAYRSTVAGVLRRNNLLALRNPALVLQPLVAPTIFLIAFAGGLAVFGRAPGFSFPSGYTSFQFSFVILQAGIFNGAFVGVTLARDLETGFAARIMLATRRRSAMLVGYVLSGVVRGVVLLVLLFVIGFIARMRVDGNALEVAGLIALPILVSVLSGLWGAGIALRFRTVQAAPMVFMPTFLALFLTPLFVPLELLEGWIAVVAKVNPFSYILQASRGFISGEPAGLGWAAVSIVGLGLALTVWALRGLRKAERAA